MSYTELHRQASAHLYLRYVVAVTVCDCCESEVTEVCGECPASVTLCEPCHGHQDGGGE
jgi:hypothetical protein